MGDHWFNLRRLYICMERDGIYIPLKQITINNLSITTEPKVILNCVSNITGIPRSVIQSRKREREIVIARNSYAVLTHALNDISLRESALYINRDHSTVLAILKSVKNDMDANPKRWSEYEQIINEVIKILNLDENIWESIRKLLSRYS